MKTLYLFRHGETDWNKHGRVQGQLESELNDHGRAQATGLIETLTPFGLQILLSSDLKRAKQTAGIVGDALGLSMVFDAALREAHLGSIQGKNISDLSPSEHDTVSRFSFTDELLALPGGETNHEVRDRAIAALTRFATESPHDVIGVCAHMFVIRLVLRRLLGASELNIANASVFGVHFDPGAQVWKPVT